MAGIDIFKPYNMTGANARVQLTKYLGVVKKEWAPDQPRANLSANEEEPTQTETTAMAIMEDQELHKTTKAEAAQEKVIKRKKLSDIEGTVTVEPWS